MGDVDRLTKKMISELKEIYNSEIEEKIDKNNSDNVSKVVNVLASKIDYKYFMQSYMFFTKCNEEDFKDFFYSCILNEVL